MSNRQWRIGLFLAAVLLFVSTVLLGFWVGVQREDTDVYGLGLLLAVLFVIVMIRAKNR